MSTPSGSDSPTVQESFFNRRFLINTGLILANSVLLLFVIKWADVVHWPYFLAAVTAAIIGFLEPRKGWMLAILQAAILWIGYTFFTSAPTNGGKKELELFCLYGSIFLTFLGSFVGGILKRASSK
ncbi:hypothetical protein GCM10028803_24760 [Larkinella knui]|uniref:Uncharacterized protein n=1 Tax=Larkinella knui TaxID=2025310 RepID=A0A3P1CXC6_9BACT|nr:hypothetical protein [Larkinella knui]RRB17534.1 hypothetical protein EHT87_04415 [Larkinella knui]